LDSLKLRILFVTSEAFPLVKTGGLADVSGSLPAALKKLEHDVRILIPAYPAVLSKIINSRYLATLSNLPNVGAVDIILGEMPDTGVPVMAIQSPALYEREGGPYVDENGKDWQDNAIRFGALSLVAAILSSEESPLKDWVPDLTHCNDWQTGLTPAYMHFMQKNRPQMQQARSIFSLHNMAFQGCFPAEWTQRLGLPAESFQMEGLEYYNQLSFLKAGIFYADGISTVSPTYGKEIQTEEYGFGLQGLLAKRGHEIHGILNGLDTTEWNPATDHYLDHHYDAKKMAGKAKVKKALRSKLGLATEPEIPLLGVVSRLTHQKGLDMLLECAETLIQQHQCQLAVLGTGEKSFEQGFQVLAQKFPGQVSTKIGYNEALSHQMMAGSDIFIMPSRFEPCGLNQMYGLRYGTPPVVTNTGGLADSVVDTNETSLKNKTATGFVMPSASTYQLLATTSRAIASFNDAKTWKAIQQNGMRINLDWSNSAQRYVEMYEEILKK
jgi:starch synthase